MEIGKMEIYRNGNMENWKFKKLRKIKGNRKNKEILINRNRE